mmetsp:Transcript_9538/g.16021  ORF Transcript_9538/g.16021 Transcript_9538/m.16021 type:complete len:84 (+) Transcript_9538:442-693(+)
MTLTGYLFEPLDGDESKGTKISWVYINDLRGSLPGMLVQMLANRMQRTSIQYMSQAMVSLQNGDLDFEIEKDDTQFDRTIHLD